MTESTVKPGGMLTKDGVGVGAGVGSVVGVGIGVGGGTGVGVGYGVYVGAGAGVGYGVYVGRGVWVGDGVWVGRADATSGAVLQATAPINTRLANITIGNHSCLLFMSRIVHGGVCVDAIDKPFPRAVGFFFGNTELSLALWNVIAGISGFDD